MTYAQNNGWKYDVEIYAYGGAIWFRIWRDNKYDVTAFPACTLGM